MEEMVLREYDFFCENKFFRRISFFPKDKILFRKKMVSAVAFVGARHPPTSEVRFVCPFRMRGGKITGKDRLYRVVVVEVGTVNMWKSRKQPVRQHFSVRRARGKHEDFSFDRLRFPQVKKKEFSTARFSTCGNCCFNRFCTSALWKTSTRCDAIVFIFR